jgi:hypothetical protein
LYNICGALQYNSPSRRKAIIHFLGRAADENLSEIGYAFCCARNEASGKETGRVERLRWE